MQNTSISLSKMYKNMTEMMENILSSPKDVFELRQKDLCLDTMHRTHNESVGWLTLHMLKFRLTLHKLRLFSELFPCHGTGGNQEWQFTIHGELKNRNSCITFDKATSGVLVEECNGSSMQKWTYNNGLLRNPERNLCLQSNEKQIVAARCSPSKKGQTFEKRLFYSIDRYCTFKQGSFQIMVIFCIMLVVLRTSNLSRRMTNIHALRKTRNDGNLLLTVN